MKHATAKKTAGCEPNNSMPITVHASGVFVAPAKTAMKPSAANKSTGAPSRRASVWPSVAPMKNRGVTSPPLKPLPSVTAVKSSFHHQLHGVAPPGEKAERIVTAPGSGDVTPIPR